MSVRQRQEHDVVTGERADVGGFQDVAGQRHQVRMVLTEGGARTGGRRQRTDMQTAVGESGMPQQEPEDLATGVSARPCNRD